MELSLFLYSLCPLIILSISLYINKSINHMFSLPQGNTSWYQHLSNILSFVCWIHKEWPNLYHNLNKWNSFVVDWKYDSIFSPIILYQHIESHSIIANESLLNYIPICNCIDKSRSTLSRDLESTQDKFRPAMPHHTNIFWQKEGMYFLVYTFYNRLR